MKFTYLVAAVAGSALLAVGNADEAAGESRELRSRRCRNAINEVCGEDCEGLDGDESKACFTDCIIDHAEDLGRCATRVVARAQKEECKTLIDATCGESADKASFVQCVVDNKDTLGECAKAKKIIAKVEKKAAKEACKAAFEECGCTDSETRKECLKTCVLGNVAAFENCRKAQKIIKKAEREEAKEDCQAQIADKCGDCAEKETNREKRTCMRQCYTDFPELKECRPRRRGLAEDDEEMPRHLFGGRPRGGMRGGKRGGGKRGGDNEGGDGCRAQIRDECSDCKEEDTREDKHECTVECVTESTTLGDCKDTFLARVACREAIQENCATEDCRSLDDRDARRTCRQERFACITSDPDVLAACPPS